MSALIVTADKTANVKDQRWQNTDYVASIKRLGIVKSRNQSFLPSIMVKYKNAPSSRLL